MAHKVVFELYRGPIPEGRVLDHLCKQRSCVNPNHTDPVTDLVNTLRGDGPTAQNARKTHCTRGHALPEARNQGRRACAEYRRIREAAERMTDQLAFMFPEDRPRQ